LKIDLWSISIGELNTLDSSLFEINIHDYIKCLPIIWNRYGAKGQPCQTPLLITNVSKVFTFMLILVVVPLYKSFVMLRKIKCNPCHEHIFEKEHPPYLIIVWHKN
jgi:hypothetical protein